MAVPLLSLLEPNVSEARLGGSTAQGAVYLGVWQPGAPQNLTVLDRFERDAGRDVAIVHWYQGWGAANAALDPALLASVRARGAAPMITWEPWDYTKGVAQPSYSLARIAAGDFDGYIRGWSTGLAAYGGPVLVRFAHEMNNPVYPWSIGVNGNTADDYLRAWRHVHDIFTASGASNVQWVWSPLIWWPGAPELEPLFPGDDVVDWVAVDGYNNPDWGGWQSFNQLFGPSYQKLTSLSSRPVMIAEIGCAEQGGSKADWITDAFRTGIPSMPRLRAVVWFNEDQRASIGVDWRIESSGAARRAYARAISSSWYRSAWP